MPRLAAGLVNSSRAVYLKEQLQIELGYSTTVPVWTGKPTTCSGLVLQHLNSLGEDFDGIVFAKTSELISTARRK